MPSTTTSGSPGAARTAATSSRSGLATPVEVSLCVSSTALYGPEDARWRASASGSAGVPHSKSSFSTSAPKMVAIFANRSPNEPMLTARTRSPGESVLTTAASIAPDPEPVRRKTSPEVPMSSAMPEDVSRTSVSNSVPRWSTIGRACASRTSAGIGVGPGVLRFCSMAA